MNPGNDWIDQARRVLDALHAGGAAADGSTAGSSDVDCRWCPVCQAAAVVRGERPELTAALADVLTATAAALRTYAGEPTPADTAGSDAAQSDVAEEDAPGAPPVAQRIDIA